MTTKPKRLPAPLVPAECSMAGNDWFPLYFDRLRKSKWWRRASDLARARNIMLWGEAYKVVPAGSLPDDDDELAEAAGYGLDVVGFTEVKAEIMAPWVLCSDGRWYHPTVCEQVLDSWEKRGSKRKAESVRKAEYRRKVREKGGGPSKKASVPGDKATMSHGTNGPVPRDTRDVPPGLGQQESTGEDIDSVASAPPSATGGGSNDPWLADPQFVALWEAATDKMRRRAKSRANVWKAWKTARRDTPAEAILGGLVGYLAGDPDIQRTGGPGLHLWLKDRTWELWAHATVGPLGEDWTESRWAAAVEIWRTTQRWEPRLGPEPGAPGCRVPPQLLIVPANQRETA